MTRNSSGSRREGRIPPAKWGGDREVTDYGQKEDSTTQAVAAGDIIKCRYTTTNGGAYTAKDVIAQVWFRPFVY